MKDLEVVHSGWMVREGRKWRGTCNEPRLPFKTEAGARAFAEGRRLRNYGPARVTLVVDP